MMDSHNSFEVTHYLVRANCTVVDPPPLCNYELLAYTTLLDTVRVRSSASTVVDPPLSVTTNYLRIPHCSIPLG